MILFGSALSPYARKCIVVAAEKGVDLEVRSTGRGNPDPQFLAASPFRKMPALVDGDFTLADSSAIIHYIEAKHPEPALIPAEPKARGQVIWFDEFADTILFDCGRTMFFNRVVAPLIFGREGDIEAAEKAEREQLPVALDYLEKVVPDGVGYLVGDGLTLADIAVASPFANFRHLEYAFDQARHGRVAAYVDRILARPAFAESLVLEQRFLAAARAQAAKPNA